MSINFFSSTQIEMNSFLSNNRKYDVVSFDVDVVKSQLHITTTLREMEDERTNDYHFTMTSRGDGAVEAKEDGQIIGMKTANLGNIIRYIMLVKTERQENTILKKEEVSVDLSEVVVDNVVDTDNDDKIESIVESDGDDTVITINKSKKKRKKDGE